MLLADWCLEILGRDPAVSIRGRYDTIDQAHALTGTRSLPMLFHALLRDINVNRTRTPDYGDIAAIKIGASVRGAIVTSGYVVIAAGGGLSRVPHQVARRVCAWRIVNA